MLQEGLLKNVGRKDPTFNKKFFRKEQVNTIFQHAFDYILQEGESKKLSVNSETKQYENTDTEIYEKELYELDKLSPDDGHKQ